MLREKWVTEGVVLALIPTLAATIAFVYEVGASFYYGIPKNFISLSWTSIALAITSVLFIYQGVISFGILLNTYIPRSSLLITQKRVLVSIPFILLSGTLLFQQGIKSVAFGISLALLIFLVVVDFFFTVIYIQLFKDFVIDPEEEQNPLIDPFNRTALLGIWVLVILAITWSTGYSQAREQVYYLTTVGPERNVVVRIYQNTIVLASFDETSRTFEKSFRFVSVGRDPDMKFAYAKIGPLVGK